MNIVVGTKVRIRSQGRSIVGVVRVVANRPRLDGVSDKWNYWDLEYDIVTPLPGHGAYGRWKQGQDGGTVEVVNDK
jgi:hypothetical protein